MIAKRTILLICMINPCTRCFGDDAPAATQPATKDNTVVIRWPEDKSDGSPKPPKTFSARFTPDALKSFMKANPDLLPLPLKPHEEQAAVAQALDRIDMGMLVAEVNGFLLKEFQTRFDPTQNLIVTPIPADQQITVDLSDVDLNPYLGPQERVVGLLLHDITEAEFAATAFRLMETARQLLDTGDPAYDQNHPDHLQRIAEIEADKIRAASKAALTAEKEAQVIRQRIGQALGILDTETGKLDGPPNWIKESRRFTYVVDPKSGTFINRLQPLVEQINRDMQIAGFAPPDTLDQPGIWFDTDLGDVEIVLPELMMREFLEKTDSLEQRMAEKAIISLEAVRLTDRDIVDGAVASRLTAKVQGVHDVERFNTDGVVRQLGIDSLLAVANQQLQVQTLRGVDAGTFPAGVSPVSIATPQLPPLQVSRTATLVGSEFSIGSDDIFFDGRQQSYGFSYVGPDGIEHRLAFDVVDSLREFWSRIERNLIVHKIKKVPELTQYKVPVGPESNTYEGIAALISQEDQQLIVATGTGAISQIDATAGTWLVIKDFEISPIPGSSTAMTDEELSVIEDKLLLTIWLRDPRTPVSLKRKMLEAPSRDELHDLLHARLEEMAKESIREPRIARKYSEVFEERHDVVLEDSVAEKKEKNSVITLTFYSSQGNIIQAPGSTQLGSANDLTSFTTELGPNKVTPLSSFMTKTLDDARGSSPTTGVRKGESTEKTKTMTHLVVRARFPTIDRERQDLEEGRQLGYFKLPIKREPNSNVHLPFLSSSEHPLERLATFRVGMMFEALREDSIRDPFKLFNPNVLEGKVSPQVWESATTRLLLNRKIISDSPGNDATLAPRYHLRFVAEVRSLLEYDSDFFDAPNFALRNMVQWNDPDRIVLALNNSPDRFALERLIDMIDELGEILVPYDYVEQHLAKTRKQFLAGHKLEFLESDEVQKVRRDAANHFLRFGEAYGDAFLEAVSIILDLGTYRALENAPFEAGPLRSYRDLVIFDRGGRTIADGPRLDEAHEQFKLLRSGGYKGKLFQPSMLTLEDMDPQHRTFVIHGTDAIQQPQ